LVRLRRDRRGHDRRRECGAERAAVSLDSTRTRHDRRWELLRPRGLRARRSGARAAPSANPVGGANELRLHVRIGISPLRAVTTTEQLARPAHQREDVAVGIAEVREHSAPGHALGPRLECDAARAEARVGRLHVRDRERHADEATTSVPPSASPAATRSSASLAAPVPSSAQPNSSLRCTSGMPSTSV